MKKPKHFTVGKWHFSLRAVPLRWKWYFKRDNATAGAMRTPVCFVTWMGPLPNR